MVEGLSLAAVVEIEGTIEDIRFRNEENGYSIVGIFANNDVVTVVGVFPPIHEGSYVHVEGEYIIHPRFGKQLKASSVQIRKPKTLSGVAQFLGSGLIRGIGPKRAALIVDTFGNDTFDVIEKTPERLSEVSGISDKMAKEIAESYEKVRMASESLVFLMNYNVPQGLAMKIFQQYGDNTIKVVSENPYQLIEDVQGVGFITADKMAASFGIPADSDFRIRAGIAYALSENSEKNGNTLLPSAELVAETSALLGIDNEMLIRKNLSDLVMSRKLMEVVYEGQNSYMTAALYKAEMSSATRLCKMIEMANRALPDCSDEIREFEEVFRVKFHKEQHNAIVSALKNGVSVITGGPGTGKTTIVKCILRILNNHGLSVKLMAPTGRAAKRLSESTGAEATTIHRALLADEDDGGLNSDVVIVDEFSMVDVSLLSSLLGNLREDAKLIIVGDADQLPSVGAGNALADIIACGKIPVAKLTHIYRQDENGKIITNAHKINAGEMPDLSNKSKDFFFISSSDTANTAAQVVKLVVERLPKYLNCEPKKIQVLAPMKSGDAGCNNLNRLLKAAIIGDTNESIMVGETTFSVGDKVMHIVNNYNLEWKRFGESGKGVFNGDAGIVISINESSGEIVVEFDDGRTATYAGEDRSQLMLAYAITVHKSQGSEYEGVVLPLSGGSPMIMTRNLLYTAVTRARNLVVIVGKDSTIYRMVNNNYIKKRYSMLSEFIINAEKKLSILYGEE